MTEVNRFDVDMCDDCGNFLVVAARLAECEARLLEVEAERDAAMREALMLATTLHRNHYSDVPQWEPLQDPAGVISQIDNMVAGIATRAEAAEAALAALENPDEI